MSTKQAVEAKIYFNIRNKTRKKIGELLRQFRFIKKNLVKIDQLMEKILLRLGKRKKTTLEISLDTRMKLDNIYKDEVSKLEKLIKKDLSIWRK